MSRDIRDVSKNNARALEMSKRRNSLELKNMENAHVEQREAVKKYQRDDLAQIQNEHQRQLAAEAQKKEKVLQNMKDHLQQTEKLTEKQLKELEQNSEKEKNALQVKLSSDRERIKGDHELYLADINETFNDKAREIHQQGEKNIAEMTKNKKTEFSDMSAHHETKINQKNQEFVERFRRDEENHRHVKDTQDRHFKKERAQTNLRQQHEMKKMTVAHTQQVEKSDDEFQKNIKSKGLEYEKAYKSTLDAHQSDLKNLADTHKKVVSKLKDSLTQEVTKSVVRSDDPFYKLTDLRPTLKELEDRVEITVTLPEHSKQDLRLTTNGKEAILNFTRRFADSHRNEAGVVNSVNKVESFTTKLTTSMILDPKTVTSKYEGGAMTYTIKKA